MGVQGGAQIMINELKNSEIYQKASPEARESMEERFEERAAIMEFDGGLKRVIAERNSLFTIFLRRNR